MHNQPSVPVRTTVVYIEADRTNALLMQALLGSRSNYTLHHANNGLGGLELCRRARPDLVITETNLPDVSAYEMLRVLRGYLAMEQLPCVVLSSDAMPAHIEQALAAGFDDYWTKPIDVWQLMQNIDDLASDSQLKFRRQRSASSDVGSLQARRRGVRSGATLQHY